jgi:mono/diheme cytochrome c family protein
VIEQFVSPSELRRLLSALMVVVGFIALAVFFAFLIVPGMRYQAHTADDSAVVAVQGENGWLDPTDYLPSRRQEIPPIDPRTVVAPTPALLDHGKALFARTCATCHGASGLGDGAGGKGLQPPPRNFTVAEGWKNGTRIEDVFRTLDEGIKGSAMVSYNYLGRKDRMALIHYVRSLATFPPASSDPEARRALEALFNSAGEVIPNRIPVRNAIAKLAEEYRPPPALPGCENLAEVAAVVANTRRAAKTVSEIAQTGASPSFARNIALGAPDNGFNVRVDTYSSSQWQQLRLCVLPH